MTLIERLRYAEKRAPNYGDLMLDAANTINEQCIEINKLRAELAALKAQAGEPVAWQHRQRGLKEYEWQEWQTVGYKPQGPESQTFQMRPLFTHPIPQAGEPNWIELEKAAAEIVRNKPTYKRFIDGTPLSNDIAVWMADFAMEHGIYQPVEPTTEPVKAQAGEPDFYVRRRPSPGYEVVSSSDPMAQPAYLHPTTERPYNPLNDYAVIPMPPTTEPVKAQAGEPVAWMNKRGDVISAEEKTLIIENGKLGYPGGEFDLHAKNIERSYTIPLGVINV